MVLKDVPPNSTVVGIPGRVVRQNGKRVNRDLDHANLPDPVLDKFRELESKIEQLTAELEALRNEWNERNELSERNERRIKHGS